MSYPRVVSDHLGHKLQFVNPEQLIGFRIYQMRQDFMAESINCPWDSCQNDEYLECFLKRSFAHIRGISKGYFWGRGIFPNLSSFRELGKEIFNEIPNSNIFSVSFLIHYRVTSFFIYSSLKNRCLESISDIC